MANYQYEELGLKLGLENWERLNQNFRQVATDFEGIGGKVLKQVVTDARLNYLKPVANFAALATTYPNAKTGDAAQTLDDNRIYRYDESTSEWSFVQELGLGPVSYLETETAKRVYAGVDTIAYAGMIRRTSTGWQLIDDVARTPLNIDSITETPTHGLEVNFSNTTSVAGMVATPDMELARHGVIIGGYASQSKLDLEAFAPLVGSIEGTVVTTTELFNGAVSAVLSADKTKLTITYDGARNAFERVNVTPMLDESSPYTGMSYHAKRVDENTVEVQAYSPFYAYVEYNVNTAEFVITSSCKASISAVWENEQLRLSHNSVPWVDGYHQRLDVQISERLDPDNPSLKARIASVTQTAMLINFYHNTTKLNYPHAGLRFYLSRPSFMVPHEIPPGASFNFDFGMAKVRPSKLGVTGNAISILGINNA